MIKIEKVFKSHGLKCVIITSSRGYRCGYVKTKDFSGDKWDYDFDVHGGITFGGDLKHINTKIKGDWLGFDCNHVGDAKDITLMDCQHRELHNEYNAFGLEDYGIVRSLEFCIDECRCLAKQISEMKQEVK